MSLVPLAGLIELSSSEMMLIGLIFKFPNISGGSRISPRRGRQLPGGGGAPTYDFAKFSQKLHEIERIWAPGGRVPRAPLRSATEYDIVFGC